MQRYSGAVTWFSPGSYEKRPRTVVGEVSNLCCAGDWVVMTNEDNGSGSGSARSRSSGAAGGALAALLDEVPDFLAGEHGAKGLCQERAYVSGMHAANVLIERLNRDASGGTGGRRFKKAEILPVREDELQVGI